MGLDKLFNLLDNFKQLNIILMYGTLLGYIREKDFIKNDDDIDVFIHKNHIYTVIEKLSNLDLNIRVWMEVKDDNTYGRVGIVQAILPESDLTLDFYVYEEIENDICIPWDGGLLYSKEDIFPLKPVIFKNIVTFIPNKPEKILEQTYGSNWNTPLQKTEYKWEEINSVKKDLSLGIKKWISTRLTKSN